MRRSSRPWKFIVHKLMNDRIVIGASAPAATRNISTEENHVGSNRVKIDVFFDQEAICSISLENRDQEITLPLPSKQLPGEIKFYESSGKNALSASLNLSELFPCSVTSLRLDGGKISASIVASENLPLLPISLKFDDGRIFAIGEATNIGPYDSSFGYSATLSIKHLLPITHPTVMKVYVFGRLMTETITVEANDVGLLGYVDLASLKGGVSGWMTSVEASDPFLITLRVDGSPLTTTLADQSRPDLGEWGIKNTRCGFTFSKELISKIAPNSQISVTMGDSEIQLVNSPCEMAA